MTLELSGVRLRRPRRGTRVLDLAPGDVLVIDGRPFVLWRKTDSGRLVVLDGDAALASMSKKSITLYGYL